MDAGEVIACREPNSTPRSSSRRLAAIVAVTVVVDQVSKALAWRTDDDAVINAGASLVAPWMDAALASSLSGATMDMAGVLLLATAAILTVRRCRDRLLWWAAALNIAGWASNLLDRLGLHWLTAPGSRRGTVDWLDGHNIADLVIWTGAALALAWLGREVLREVGWDLRQAPHRVAAGVAGAAVTGLVLAGMTSTGGGTHPKQAPEREATAESSGSTAPCRDPAFALAPRNVPICADDPSAAHPVEVTSAITCTVDQAPTTVHVTITNPNRDRRARFRFAAPRPVGPLSDAAPHGHLDAGGQIHVRLSLPRSTDPAALYLETAVQVWEARGSRWVIGTERLWTNDLCGESVRPVRTAQAQLLCDPTGVAHVALSPQPLTYHDDHQLVVLSWTSPMAVATNASDQGARRSGFTIDLTEQFLTVVRIVPHAATDSLVVTGWGGRTIQHDGRPPVHQVALPVGRCGT